MKEFGSFSQDGFKGSIELIRFLKAMNADIVEALLAIIGNNTVFVKGGEITEALGSTTIADGIIAKDGQLYAFSGGTYVGVPNSLFVLFETMNDPNFPKPYFVNNPVPQEIYLGNFARIDTSGAVQLDLVGSILDIQKLTQKAALVDAHEVILPNKANKFGYQDITGVTYNTSKIVNLTTPIVRKYDSGMVHVSLFIATLAGISVTNSDWLVRNLPRLNSGFGTKLFTVLFADSLGAATPGLSKQIALSAQAGGANFAELGLYIGTIAGEQALYIDIEYFSD